MWIWNSNRSLATHHQQHTNTHKILWHRLEAERCLGSAVKSGVAVAGCQAIHIVPGTPQNMKFVLEHVHNRFLPLFHSQPCSCYPDSGKESSRMERSMQSTNRKCRCRGAVVKGPSVWYFSLQADVDCNIQLRISCTYDLHVTSRHTTPTTPHQLLTKAKNRPNCFHVGFALTCQSATFRGSQSSASLLSLLDPVLFMIRDRHQQHAALKLMSSLR